MFHIPRKSELVAINNKVANNDVKPAMERALDSDEVVTEIEPYLVNGGAEGHSLLDLLAALKIIAKHDDTIGNGTLRKSGLNSKQLIDQMRVVLRRRYVLDKKSKIIGVNPKRYLYLSDSSAA